MTDTITPAPRRAALAFIFFTALLDTMSLGIIIPVLPNLVKAFAGGDIARAALWVGLFSTVWSLMQFVASPILGMLSDRFGRRPVILLSVLGLGLDYLFMALAPSLAWLFLGRIVHGVTAASFATAGAYIADVTPPENRAKSFGLIGAAWGVGFVLGPALGGYLGDVDLRLPFWVAAGLALANFVYGVFILPESLPPERRTKRFEWAKANPLGSFRLLSSQPELRSLAVVAALHYLAYIIYPAVFVLYTGHRYGWTPADVGLALAATGVCGIIVSALLIGPVVKRIGERRALLAGLASGATGLAIYGFAPNENAYWLAVPIAALWGLAQPNMMALMSRRLRPDQQGQLQGAISAIAGVTGLVGPALFTGVFAFATANELPLVGGEAVLVAAALVALALLLAARAARPEPGGITASSPAAP